MANTTRLNGRLIRRLRNGLDITQAQLAQDIGVSQGRMSQIESDTAPPLHPPVVEKLASILHIAARDLYMEQPPDSDVSEDMLHEWIRLRDQMDALITRVLESSGSQHDDCAPNKPPKNRQQSLFSQVA